MVIISTIRGSWEHIINIFEVLSVWAIVGIQ